MIDNIQDILEKKDRNKKEDVVYQHRIEKWRDIRIDRGENDLNELNDL